MKRPTSRIKFAFIVSGERELLLNGTECYPPRTLAIYWTPSSLFRSPSLPPPRGPISLPLSQSPTQPLFHSFSLSLLIPPSNALNNFGTFDLFLPSLSRPRWFPLQLYASRLRCTYIGHRRCIHIKKFLKHLSLPPSPPTFFHSISWLNFNSKIYLVYLVSLFSH